MISPDVPLLSLDCEVARIRRYYEDRHVAPALVTSPRTTIVEELAHVILAERRGERPLSIASWGTRSAALIVGISKHLLASGMHRFHADCIVPSAGRAATLARATRAAGLGGHVSFIDAEPGSPSRAPGTYDVHVAVQELGDGASAARCLDSISRSMTSSSLLLLAQRIAPGPGVPRPEARPVLAELWTRLLPKHRYDHSVGRFAATFEDAFPADDGEAAGEGADPLISALAKSFDADATHTFGGLVDTFVGGQFGPCFDPDSPGDRAFIDHLCGLESELRATGALRPSELVARLRPKGHGAAALDVSRFTRRGDAPSLARTLDFRFPEEEIALSHMLSGRSDERFLGDGFFYWEASQQLRWTGRTFSLVVPLPFETVPYTCRLRLAVVAPSHDAGGGLTVLANGVRVARVESVYRTLLDDPSHELRLSFVATGGRTTLTFALDTPQKPPDAADARELGLVIRAFTVSIVRDAG
jgi:hypothetical protein